MKKTLLGLLLLLFSTQSTFGANPFWFGIRIQGNDPVLAQKIEKTFGVDIRIITVIYDDFSEKEQSLFLDTIARLGNKRIYHIALNPFGYSAEELLDDPAHKGWKEKYRTFFRIVKEKDLKVIFRPLHEMNGGWYSWSSDPKNYRPLWRLIWQWSREEWLSRENILFNFCANSEDLPKADAGIPTQEAKLINCTQSQKELTGCFTFEDYYPGDKYVDTVGITLYNWGQGARKESWATWRFPPKIVNEYGYNTLNRLKKTGKPIFLDEAWSTSIKYDGAYNHENLVAIYNDYHLWNKQEWASGTPAKNEWLMWYHDLLKFDDQIIGGSYFNADVTNGLQDRSQIGELDWTVLDPEKYFIYPAIKNIFQDPSATTDPYLYFDLPDSLRKRLAFTEQDAQDIHQVLRRLYPFFEGDIVVKNRIASKQAGPRYQYFLEKYLNSQDKVMCHTLKKAYPSLACKTLNKQEEQQIPGAIKLMQMLGSSDIPNENRLQIALLAQDELDNSQEKWYIDSYIKNHLVLPPNDSAPLWDSQLPNIPNNLQEIKAQVFQFLQDYFWVSLQTNQSSRREFQP